MDVLLACMAGDHACAWCLRRPAEGVGVLGPLGLELRATGCVVGQVFWKSSPRLSSPPYLWFSSPAWSPPKGTAAFESRCFHPHAFEGHCYRVKRLLVFSLYRPSPHTVSECPSHTLAGAGELPQLYHCLAVTELELLLAFLLGLGLTVEDCSLMLRLA